MVSSCISNQTNKQAAKTMEDFMVLRRELRSWIESYREKTGHSPTPANLRTIRVTSPEVRLSHSRR